MSGLFHAVEGGQVVLVSRGVYGQAALLRRGEHAYAEAKKGQFVRLQSNGGTSAPMIRWDGIETDLTVDFDKLGRMTLT